MTLVRKETTPYVDDLDVTMAENPSDGDEIGSVSATSEVGRMSYALIAESPVGAIKLDSSTGELTVRDASLFNFEINPVITATVEADNGPNTENCEVTITLTDVAEIPAVIGYYRDGGIVFWVHTDDPHQGMVCSLEDLASFAFWGCWSIFGSTLIDGANGTEIGTGMQNTLDIVNGCDEDSIAADLCLKYDGGGYTDWFLPCVDEIRALSDNQAVVNAAAVNNGGTALDSVGAYWTSTQANTEEAYDFYFPTGDSRAILKLNWFGVRAVRAF